MASGDRFGPWTGHVACLLLVGVLCWMLELVESADSCHWRDSGLPYDLTSQNVKPVYMDCKRGRIQWDYPYGAVRIVISPKRFDSDFVLCVRPDDGFYGANVYHQTPGGLEVISLQQEEKFQKTMCFESVNGAVPIFMETELNQGEMKHVILHYEVKQKSSTQLIVEECEPCNSTELLKAYCSSDFVVKAAIRDIVHNAWTDQSELDLSISKLYFQKEETFTPTEQGYHRGRVVAPLHCQMKVGRGHFLLSGSYSLGQSWLRCMPRYEDFRKLAWEAEKNGTNYCKFDG